MDLQHEDFATNLWKTITDHAVLHVQHLNIALYGLVVKVDSWKLKYALDRLSVTLETLTIQLDTDSLENGEGSSEIKSWTSLKELKLLKYRNTTDTGSFWSWLWTRCGHVETLEVSTVGEGNAQNLAEVIQTHMPNLDTIRLRQGDDRFRLEDEHIATLLSGPYHGWKTVDMSRNVGIGRLSLEALTNHFPTLVELKVDGCSGFSGESLVQVLSSCPNLRSLVAISNGNFPSQTKFLAVDAKVFIDRDRSTGSLKTWSCESMLKVLKVKIGNIPRPELTLPNTNQETYLGQGQEIQNLVYERLGRLTSLQVLWLGHDPYFTAGVPQNEDRALQMNCLEMSLESGLGRLSGLKEMKELGMSRMRKNTGMKEIQWMKKHWPKLEKTHGLDTGNGAKESELRWKILRDQRNQMHAVTWARRALDARSNGSSTTSYTCGDFHRR
ncbi:hypothetical protein BGX31_006196 [Mortierella sp. GBA43]|nr:hypothetical protein BGX31_006196 [Mortierella sp. GBA43]